MLLYLLRLALITATTAFSIQGNWTLIAAPTLPLPPQNLTLQITEFIFEQQRILQRLSFSACSQLTLQAQFAENQIFFNLSSAVNQPIGGSVCGPDNVLDRLSSVLQTVFFFEINIDKLLLNDPYGVSVLTFQRQVGASTANITGIWNMNQFGNTMTSLSVQISSTQITLCQGNLVFNYTLLPSQNAITLLPILSNCSSQELTRAMASSKYFRLNNGLLDFYDATVSISAELVYSQPFNPSRPIFADLTQAQTGQSGGSSNLVGTWRIVNLFNIPLSQTAYSIVFTANSLLLRGGCNNFSFPYSANPSTQLISLGNSTSTNNPCASSDDQLYLSGVLKMHKYLLSTTPTQTTLSFYDKSGTIGYRLQSGSGGSSPVKAPGSKAGAAGGPGEEYPLSAGTYLLLLLSRRDLPRLLVSIAGNTITYQGCNTIRQAFTPGQLTLPQSSISISGGPTTTNKCSVDNDSLYYSALNQAASYVYDSSAGTVILSDSSRRETATLSRAT